MTIPRKPGILHDTPNYDDPETYRCARRLLLALIEKDFPDASPKFEPLPDTIGVLTQIDNLTSDMVRKPKGIPTLLTIQILLTSTLCAVVIGFIVGVLI